MRAPGDLPYIEWTDASGALTRIYADAMKREEIGATATVTLHAVETGSKVSDHYLPDPLTLKVEMFFSGSPVRGDLVDDAPGIVAPRQLQIPAYPPGPSLLTPRGLTTAVEGLIGLPGPGSVPDQAQVLSFEQDPARVERVYRQLLVLRAARNLVTVGNSVDVFENLAITDLPYARSADDGDSGSITISFTQLAFVQSDVAVAPPLVLEPRAQKPKNGNVGGTTEATGPKKTALKKLLDDATGP